MFFSKSQKGALILIIDIQSSIVRATLVHYESEAKPRIIFSTIKKLNYRVGTGSKHLIKAGTDALKVIMVEVHHFIKKIPTKGNLSIKIDQVHYVLSSPWIITQAKTISHTFERETKVTEKIIHSLMTKERAHTISGSSVKGSELDIIEEKIFDVLINGYKVDDWNGRSAKKLDISYATSITGAIISESLKEACTVVPKNKISFHSSLLLQFMAIQHITPSNGSYNIIHVHGELTDVSIINNHACVFFGSFPIGEYGLIRLVASEGNMNIELADSTISIHSHKGGDESRTDSNHAAIKKGRETWGAELKQILSSNADKHKHSLRTILSGHNHEIIFVDGIKSAYPHMVTHLLADEQLTPYVKYDIPEAVSRLSGLYTIAIHSMIKPDMLS